MFYDIIKELLELGIPLTAMVLIRHGWPSQRFEVSLEHGYPSCRGADVVR